MKKIIFSSLVVCLLAIPAIGMAGDHGDKMKKHFKMADTNDDGKVTEQEFVQAAVKRFKKMDKNGDGVLDKQDHKKHKHD